MQWLRKGRNGYAIDAKLSSSIASLALSLHPKFRTIAIQNSLIEVISKMSMQKRY
jgi:hypothetical protein